MLNSECFLIDVCPFVYANEGDSYFVSPEMYQALVAVCRCGRPRRGLHLLKCLQNQKNKCATSKQQKDIDNPKEHRIFNKLPETTNGWLKMQFYLFKISAKTTLYTFAGFVGYTQQQQAQQPSYKKWEDSMKYRSPQYDMPGQRITATSYNTIIIGQTIKTCKETIVSIQKTYKDVCFDAAAKKSQ